MIIHFIILKIYDYHQVFLHNEHRFALQSFWIVDLFKQIYCLDILIVFGRKFYYL